MKLAGPGADTQAQGSASPAPSITRNVPQMPRPYERSYYRIPYSSLEGPRLVVGYHVCRVVDCSERGLRYLAPAHALPPVGSALRGRLRFPRGAEVEVEGQVLRVDGREVALRLAEPGVPFRVILQEQIYLRRIGAC